jgi:hypothetical protein
MKKRIILIIGIIVALFAIWQTVMGEPFINSMISESSTGKDTSIVLENSPR